MGGTQSKPGTVVQALLYGPAPFFAYPWKPLLNSQYGGGYSKSYRHFRMQHMDGTNLLLHCLCLVWQLSSNYALLGELDEWLEPVAAALGLSSPKEKGHLVTRATSLLWCVHLLRTAPTPAIVKLASAVSIYAAHMYVGPFFAANWRNVVFLQGALEAVGVQRLVLNKQTSVGAHSLLYFLVRTAIWRVASANEGCLKKKSTLINALALVWTALISSSKSPLGAVTLGLYGWLLALLTGNKATYFWSAGMMATVSQGIAHRVAGEAGTLEVLQNDSFDQTSYELSHVTFFPNLLFQACYAHLKAQS